MKKTVLFSASILLIVFATLSLYIASLNPMKSTVKSVVYTLFTCPNKEILIAYEAMEKWVSGDEKVNYVGDAVDKLYASYFTETALLDLKRWRATDFTLLCSLLGYTISVDKIDIYQDEKNQYYYHFLAYLSYGKEGIPLKYVIQDGTVLFDENEKIKYLWFSKNFVDSLWDLAKSTSQNKGAI